MFGQKDGKKKRSDGKMIIGKMIFLEMKKN